MFNEAEHFVGIRKNVSHNFMSKTLSLSERVKCFASTLYLFVGKTKNAILYRIVDSNTDLFAFL